MVQRLASVADAEAMLAASQRQPVLLLKHSATCPISAAGRAEFEAVASEAAVPCYMVVVQTARAASAFLAEALDVRHETPQAILVDAGTAVYSASHGRVRTHLLTAALRTHATP